MVNSVKVFVKDYSNLLRHEVRFYKQHWKGTVATNLVLIGGIAAAGAAYTVHQEKEYERNKRRHNHKKEEDVKVEYKVEPEE